MKTIKRFGVSLEEGLLSELDGLAKRQKFPSRSQAIRFLIRNNVVEDAWQSNKDVAGCIVLIYDHHKRDLVNKSLDIQHKFGHLILSSQHVHLDHHSCLEMVALKGSASGLKELADSLISLKGIKHGRLVMTGV
ncbi:MAG: nickel-responsive transcriptional regulator NikR [Candidatus Omnitrophica bacterium]|nr:nickel-responsive transcriptional regulator NikR [Candidatus Omnitrophota bacterium]